MILAHAKALAIEFVVRDGIEYPKNGPFSPQQLAADDWVPIQTLPPDPNAPIPDCGCDGVPFTNDTLETLDAAEARGTGKTFVPSSTDGEISVDIQVKK